MTGASKYRIVPKRDFGSGPGFWTKGAGTTGTGMYGFVKQGFVVVNDHCRIVNVMPGATWFLTIADAFHGIACLEQAGGSAAEFWRLIRERHAA